MKIVKLRRQRPIKGGRARVAGGVDHRIERAIDLTMRRFAVTRPYVITVALAEFFGIELDARDQLRGE